MADSYVRPARVDDIEEISQVTYDSWQSTYAGILDTEFLESMQPPAEAGVPDEQREWLETAIDHEQIAELVATDDGAVVGFAELIWTAEHTRAFVADGNAGLRALYLEPDYLRRGIGTRLLERALDTLPDHCSRLVVGVLAANEGARRFYETNGFEQVDSTTFETDSGSYPECVYARAP